MGEAKRKRQKLSPVEQAGVDLTHRLANEGKLLEGGFAAWLMNHKVPVEHPDLALFRDLYFSGAEHLWSSIMLVLDPGAEPTDRDIQRMDLIYEELELWRKYKLEALAKSYPTKGTA